MMSKTHITMGIGTTLLLLHPHTATSISAVLIGGTFGAIYQIYPAFLPRFCIGCLSHLLLDCLNKKPVRLLYPVKTGFCMKLCYADGAANKVLLWVGVLLTFCGFVLSWMIALLL